METTEEIRKKLKKLINERGHNYAQLSLAIGKNIAYLQQFIKNGSPRRLGEVERHKLAQILRVDEQELTDLPLPYCNGNSAINVELMTLIIENAEQWIVDNNRNYSPRKKAELIRFIYTKLQNETIDTAIERMREYIEIFDELKKVG